MITDSEVVEDESDYPYKYLRDTNPRILEAEMLLKALKTSSSNFPIANTVNSMLLRVLQSKKEFQDTRNSTESKGNFNRNGSKNLHKENSKNLNKTRQNLNKSKGIKNVNKNKNNKNLITNSENVNKTKFLVKESGKDNYENRIKNNTVLNLKEMSNNSNDTTNEKEKLLISKLLNSNKLKNLNMTERRKQFKRFLNDDIINLVHVNNSSKSYKLKYADQWKRKSRQLDTYAESLLYVNRIYNAAYRFERRRVPAHMPHLLDKWIINDMQNKFDSEFKKTSSHKVRSAEDMQFAFSYFYFLVSERRQLTASEIFDLFDTDKSL